MYNGETKLIHITRDICWMNRIYYAYDGSRNYNATPFDNDMDDESIIDLTNDDNCNVIEIDNNNNDNDDEQIINSNESSSDEDDNANETEVNKVPMGLTQGHGTVINEQGEQRSTRITSKPALLIDEMGATRTNYEREEYVKEYKLDEYAVDPKLLPFHNTQYDMIHEYSLVGAASSGGFDNTPELIPMKYDAVMQTKDKEGWKQAVKEEWEQFEKYKVFKEIKRSEVPDNAKFVSTTWALKKKSNGTL